MFYRKVRQYCDTKELQRLRRALYFTFQLPRACRYEAALGTCLCQNISLHVKFLDRDASSSVAYPTSHLTRASEATSLCLLPSLVHDRASKQER